MFDLRFLSVEDDSPRVGMAYQKYLARSLSFSFSFSCLSLLSFSLSLSLVPLDSVLLSISLSTKAKKRQAISSQLTTNYMPSELKMMNWMESK